ASDIASMLKSLPPNSIASIEIMRTPSSRYEASSSGGIVNVVLKKGFKIGLTGSVHTGINQGKFGDRWIGFNLNNSTGKVSTFLNLQHNSRNSFQRNETDRLFTADSTLSLNSYSLNPGNSYSVNYGINIEAKKQWELGYDGRLNYNDNENRSDNLSQIRALNKTETSVRNQTNLINNSQALNFSQGVNAKYKIDSLGSEWTSDVSFNYLPATTDQDYLNMLLQPRPSQNSGFGDIKTSLRIVSLQSNLLYKFPKRWTMETGLKISNLLFDSNRDFFTRSGDTQSSDGIRSGIYDYQENINAGYAQLSKSFGPFTIKGGTRMENTNMKGREAFPSDTTFSVNRTDFFPYLYFQSEKLVSIFGIDLKPSLIYRRTIARPGYQLLNPAQRFVDQYAYESGNPALKPQFVNTYEVRITAMDFPVLQLGVNDTKDIFNSVLYSDNKSQRITYRTYDNLGRNREAYFQIAGGIPPGRKYFFYVMARYNHNFYRGLYEQQPLTFRRGGWFLASMHQLKITPETQVFVHGFASLNVQSQFRELSDFGGVYLTINQQLLKKKLTVSAGLNDIFRTSNNSYTLAQGNINVSGRQSFDNRRFSLSLRYNFGLNKKEQKDSNLFNFESPDKAE
ncbi:MAG TPA: outer membrane beta-barrel protein, partial [Pedobacter sp.]